MGICPGVSERLTPTGTECTIDGRRWAFGVTSRGGAMILALRGLGLAPHEFGVMHVRLVDRRKSPPVAHSPMRCIVHHGQASLLQLPTVAEMVENGSIINGSLAITLSAYALPSPPKKQSLLSKDFGHILESGDGSDVSFRVGDEDFPAHRLVIQARSPALAAEIPAAPGASIAIGGDIDPKAFGAFLKFLYTEDLPGAEEILGEEYSKESGCQMRESLFHVAERFNHEEMKGILEEQMLAKLDASTAARTLSFAEQHGRQQLQETCCRMVVSKGWLQEVIQSDGWFGHLMPSSNYPTVAKDALLLEASRALKKPRGPVPNAGA